eukprot:scaffold13.g407.t1
MDGKKKPAEKASPPVKVVGFHVEGASPSPRNNMLSEAAAGGGAAAGAGSPTPMIILPMFPNQARSPQGGAALRLWGRRMLGQPSREAPLQSVSSTGAAAPTPLAPAAGAAAEQPDSVRLRGIRTESSKGLDPESFASDRSTPTKAVTPTRSGALPLTPIGSAPADIGSQLADMATSPRVMRDASAAPAATAAALAPKAVAAAAAAAAATHSPPRSDKKPPPQAPSPAAQQHAQQQASAAAPQQRTQQQHGPAGRGSPPKGAAGAATKQPQKGKPQQQHHHPPHHPQTHPKPPKAQAPPTQAPHAAQQQQQQHKGGAAQQGGGEEQGAQKKGQKEMTKAERRALQEAQRAAKAAAKAAAAPGGGAGAAGAPPKPLSKQGSSSSLAAAPPPVTGGKVSRQSSTAAAAAAAAAPASGRAHGASADARAHQTSSTELFAHLQQYRRMGLQELAARASGSVPLPALLLGLRMAAGEEFKVPSGREFAKEFAPALNTIVAFLVSCRPLSISMGNAIKARVAVKKTLEEMKLEPSTSEQQDKDRLCDRIHKFQEEKIQYALAGVVRHAVEKIGDGDTLLTYSFSSVVASCLLAAHAAGKRFTVIVADCRPLFEGRCMVQTLLAAGISCEYTHLNGLSFCLSQVLLGGGAVLSNGTVLARVGTAAVAMMAAAERLPVLVCCETYKFHERVQLDSITHNELGDPQALAQVPDRPDVPGLPDWESKDRLALLNLAYDAMPADFVSVIITEMGLLPPTSVAVVLREAQRDQAA